MLGRHPQAARLRAIAGALAEPHGAGVAGSEAELATTRWELVPAGQSMVTLGDTGYPTDPIAYDGTQVRTAAPPAGQTHNLSRSTNGAP
jgi:hypothetical protein